MYVVEARAACIFLSSGHMEKNIDQIYARNMSYTMILKNYNHEIIIDNDTVSIFQIIIFKQKRRKKQKCNNHS